MSDTAAKMGAVEWRDLTVADAAAVSEFYASVVGWEPSPVSMGDYDDFNMLIPGTDEPAAGICHARGFNSELPAQWLMYVKVPDLPSSVSACEAGGGKVLVGPKTMGETSFCVIEDPAGAVLALMSG